MTLAQVTEQPGVDLEPLVSFIASQLQLPTAALADYAAREQTMTDHARELGAALGLRPPARTDLSLMIDAAASAAWSTDKGAVLAGAVVAALRAKSIMLPSTATIERAGTPDELLAHTSPVGWEHIAFSGDFLWDQAAALATGRRHLTLGRRKRGAA